MIHLVISLNSRWWYFSLEPCRQQIVLKNWRGHCSGETIKTVLKTFHVDNYLKLLKFVKSGIV